MIIGDRISERPSQRKMMTQTLQPTRFNDTGSNFDTQSRQGNYSALVRSIHMSDRKSQPRNSGARFI